MKRFGLLIAAIVVTLIAFIAGYLVSRMSTPDLPYQTPTYALNGVVTVPSFKLPPSSYMSDEAVNLLKLRSLASAGAPDLTQSIEKSRAGIDKALAPFVAKMKQKYPVEIEETSIAGIPARIFSPVGLPTDPDRVLINLHGGGFSVCWDSCSILESAPISVLGGYKVISVNYRMGPEATHPAAVDDVLAVYSELMKSYKAQNIGIYGCSAGGALTGQAAAMITSNGLPSPGGVGIFGAGALRFATGDSSYIAAYIDGSFPPPAKEGEQRADMYRGYFDGADVSGRIISPALHLDVLAKFPPTLVTTGTRAADLSPAVFTNSQLIKAGVDSRLIVAEGMGHCYQYIADFPEARDAYDATVSFFKKNLK
jgi:monoterpene epsilon-lactone hydrolase